MKIRNHRVKVKTPHISSMAALILLSLEYRMHEVKRWMDFRDEFLDDFEVEYGRLFCEYCDKDDLIREVPEGMKKSHRLATIDHVIPLSRGGAKFEKDNLKLACFTCNQKKADNMPV